MSEWDPNLLSPVSGKDFDPNDIDHYTWRQPMNKKQKKSEFRRRWWWRGMGRELITAVRKAVGEMCVNCNRTMSGHSIEGGCMIPGPYLYAPRQRQTGWPYWAGTAALTPGATDER